ncbi:MAG: HNH endonuclease [Gammaproteobacteria bacterium]
MPKPGRLWTREELILAFALYCRIPFAKADKGHPEVIRLAEIIGRTPSAVNLKIGNFGSFDPRLKERGIGGLPHVSKTDREIWDSFNQNFPELSKQAFEIENKMSGKKHAAPPENAGREGKETRGMTIKRVNQGFFRDAILASYESQCCITGIGIREVLVASHIKPWAQCDSKEKLNPRNGLCLNALHDRAFDRGLMTVTADFRVKISEKIKQQDNDAAQKWLGDFDGREIQLPEKFMPSADFLDWHGQHVFRA